MSTSYYLVDENKKKENDKLKTFWDKQFIPKIEDMLRNFCKNNEGDFITPDLAEDVLLSPEFSAFVCSCPKNSDIYNDKLCQIGSGVVWHNVPTQDNTLIISMTGTTEYKLSCVKRFLEKNPDYNIYDEYGDKYSFNAFRKIIMKTINN